MTASVFKIKRYNHYTTIGNDIINNIQLSWGARGLLIYLLSKPEHWEVRINDLVNSSEKEGLTKVRNFMRELREAGYVQIIRGRFKDLTGKEKFGAYYQVSDVPYDKDEKS